MIKEVLDIIGEGEDVLFHQRFSVMLGSTYMMYIWFYYYLVRHVYKTLTFNATALLSLLHILQVLGIRYFFKEENFRYAWLAIVLPILLFLIYQKYMERQAILEKQKYLKFKAMMEREKKMSQPADLVGMAPKPEYIIPEQKIAPQTGHVIMPQHGGQQSPPIPHYTGTSGAAPQQSYDYGGQIPQYTTQNMGQTGGYNDSSFYQSSPEYEDPFGSSEYSLF